MMVDIWTLLWLLVCLTILISVLESIYRRVKERQLRQQEFDLQRQIQAQQYHVYTLQPLTNPLQRNSASSVLSPQQQEYIHQQQELKASNDLPPKYEDVVKDFSYSIPIGYAMPSSSSAVQRPYDMPPPSPPPPSTDVNTNQTVRY